MKKPQNIKTNIKLFHVFNDFAFGTNIIFVTNERKVYGFGRNSNRRLGFGHNKEVEECTQIKELSNQKIKEFDTLFNT